MLRLAPSWVWDFWLADDGERFHLFYLKASRALGEQQRRHWRAGVGHAVSEDLVHWSEVADALVAADEPSFDDLATWTGSVVRDPTGPWRMFYTGVDRAGGGLVQRIGQATSEDLTVWERTDLRLEPDPRWYETAADHDWPDVTWRDPWVMADPAGGWRMLVTARAAKGERGHRGVVGLAISPDLVSWEVQPPTSTPDAGFGQLEVLQVAEVAGRPVLLFSCLHTEMAPERVAAGERGGVWAVRLDGPVDRVDLSRAHRLTSEALYSGRVVRDRAGADRLLAFRHVDQAGDFVGELTDPLPVGWEGDRLVLRDVPSSWRP